jgi:hypothetical protein
MSGVIGRVECSPVGEREVDVGVGGLQVEGSRCRVCGVDGRRQLSLGSCCGAFGRRTERSTVGERERGA